MQRLIQDLIRKSLADELLFGRLADGGRVVIGLKMVDDGKGGQKGEIDLNISALKKETKASKPEEETAAE